METGCTINECRCCARDVQDGDRQRLPTKRRIHHTNDARSEIFVHHTSIQSNGFKSLAEGDKVSFDTEKGPKGPKAINVVKL